MFPLPFRVLILFFEHKILGREKKDTLKKIKGQISPLAMPRDIPQFLFSMCHLNRQTVPMGK